MNAETGCHANHIDAKKEKIFSSTYAGQEIIVHGEVDDVKDKDVRLRILPETITHDLLIHMSNTSGLDDLDKGSQVTIKFIVKNQGGCFLPFVGEYGQILR